MKKIFIIVGILALCFSSYFFNKSYDKYSNYKNYDDYSSLNQNAYVGGDAYNYIINGNYFSGFNILGVGFILLGFTCFGIAHISGQKEKQIEILENISEKFDSLNNNEK